MEENILVNEALTVTDRAMELVDNINSPETYEQAGTLILSLKDTIKKIKDYWKEPKEKAHQAHKAITEKENQMLKPVQSWHDTLTKKVSQYLTEQDRKRREEQNRLDEERRKAEQAEKDKLEKKAEKAEAKGDTDKADQLKEMAQSVYIPPTMVEPVIEKKTSIDTGTISAKEDIEVEVVYTMDLIKEVINGNIPVGIITINEVKLKQYIKSFNLTSVSGCIIRKTVSAQFRAKK